METLEKRLEKAEAIVGRVGVMERDMAGNSGVSSNAIAEFARCPEFG
ncbi:hypothetical protein M1O16_00610 [Dehalococcoidia bacterium]|nr:hypothetical protein [Dehalococcoidia bacterium]